jgi:alginate O-acetyltransferase complex protein AlgI
MLFNTTTFAVFLAIVTTVYYWPAMRRWQIEWLLAASLVFYAWEQPWLLGLLLLSAGITSAASYATMTGPCPALAAAIGVAVNLGVLAFFKYNRLVAESLLGDLARIGSVGEALLYLPLPAGISFYTFHGISLVIDSWRKKYPRPQPLRPLPHTRNTLLYIVFFPQLVAGPIVKAAQFMPQIGEKRAGDIDWRSVVHNCILGYFLKTVIADNLAQQTAYISCPACLSLASVDLLALLVAYSAQIFADFCGYSMIAIGIASLLGYQLPINFNRPYIADSFADFWRRWHISLSSFLKEYLYLPLGGNRRGRLRTYLNLMIVMGLGGLWHGAAWSYAVWGLWHGTALALERLAADCRLSGGRSPAMRCVRIIAVFAFVTLGWLLFKLPDFGDALQYLQAIASNTQLRPSSLRLLVISAYVAPIVIYHLLPSSRLPERGRQAIEGLLLGAIILNSGSSHAFIYFQF